MSAAPAQTISPVTRRVPPAALLAALSAKFGDRFSTSAAMSPMSPSNL